MFQKKLNENLKILRHIGTIMFNPQATNTETAFLSKNVQGIKHCSTTA